MHKKIYKKLDPGTWGGYKASHRLVEILNEPDKNIYRTKVANCFQSFVSLLLSLKPIRYTKAYSHFTKKHMMTIKSIYFPRHLMYL